MPIVLTRNINLENGHSSPKFGATALLNMVSNPYLVIRRIVDKGRTWGALIQYQGRKMKLTYQELVDVVDSKKRPVVVDFPNRDVPVSLTAISMNGKLVLKTIADGEIKNNFNKIKAIKLVTCNKYRYLVKRK